VADLRLETHGPAEALAMLDTLADIYTRAYTGKPYDAEPAVYSRQAFTERTTRHAAEPGFALVTGHLDDQIAGLAYGLHDEPGQWLPGESDPPPPAEIVNSSRFFVVELIVREPYRGHGYAHRLMDGLLAGRSERYAALTTQPGGFPQQMYLRWGWRRLCALAYAHAPVTFDVMIKDLTT
jgi:GNAT superfamily N-acetyltransferase